LFFCYICELTVKNPKEMKKNLPIIVFTLLFSFCYSQRKETNLNSESNILFEDAIASARTFAPNGVIRCATDEYTKSKQRSGLAPSDEAFEAWLAPKIAEIKRLRQLGRLPSVIRIPVVVHVIHNGDALGTGENIADGQVLSQITVFNQDFRRMAGTPGFNTSPVGADTTIEFCMAVVDPNGNPTNGINRVNLGTAQYTSQAAVEAAKANTIWDPTKYLNMWTFRFGGSMGGILGYAQFPTGSGLQGMPAEDCITGEASTDGVVAAFNTFGSRTLFPSGTYNGTSYDKGRTMTHEVGHMFGLRHIWGDGGCGIDDYCADTPESDAANFGCPTTHISCGTIDMVRNYMDYTDDSCMNIFTQDQKDRMLAVLMNSPRRDDLLVSTVCVGTSPYIQFKRQACELRLPKSYGEGAGCNFTDVTIPLSISKAPSSNATVTFLVDASSTANINDIEFLTPTLTFNAGSTADQNLVLRIYNDGYVEGNEILIVNFNVNNNGGDALKNPNEDDVYKITIIDNDVAVTPLMVNTLFSDDFSDGNSNGWTILDANGNTADDWTIVSEANWNPAFGIYTDFFMASYSWNGVPYSPNNYLSSPLISIPAGATNINLSYFAGSGNDPDFYSENYEVWISNSIGSQANITSGLRLVDSVIPAMGGATYNVAIPNSYAGQNVYISFRHHDTTDEWLLGIDNVIVTAEQNVSVQTVNNLATAGQNRLKGTGLAYFRDSASGNAIGSISVNDVNNYECTSMYVSSQGTGAVQYGASTNPIDFRMDKQFTITPANVLSSGNSTITFYFTEAEIAGWETATGNARSLLHVVKDNGTTEVQPCAIGSFGSDVTLTATFASGIDGVYSFARQESLGADNFDLTGVSIYPNPNNGEFTLKLNSMSGKVNVGVYDVRGRLILNRIISNSGIVNETINLDNVQSGVYLITVQDGDRKTTKKIVVQ